MMPCFLWGFTGADPDFHYGRIWVIQNRWVHWRYMPNMSCIVKCWDAPIMGTLKSLILWSIYKAPAAIRPSNSKLVPLIVWNSFCALGRLDAQASN